MPLYTPNRFHSGFHIPEIVGQEDVMEYGRLINGPAALNGSALIFQTYLHKIAIYIGQINGFQSSLLVITKKPSRAEVS